MAEIVQTIDNQAAWQTGELDGVEAATGGDLVLGLDYSMSFDGIDDYVFISDAADIRVGDSDFEISVSFSSSGIADKSVLFWMYNQGAGNRQIWCRVESSVIKVIADNGSAEFGLSCTNEYLDGLKHTLTVSRIENLLTLEIDGTTKDTVSISGDISGATTNGVVIGAYVVDKNYSWEGNIDSFELSISGALCAGYYFTDGSGFTLTDVTDNGNDGTINGANWVWAGDGTAVTTPITGTRTAPPINLSTLGQASATSTLSWSATDNSQTITVETSVSTDNGSTWSDWATATNGGHIPGITTGMDLSNTQLKCRQTLSTTDTSVTPQLHNLTITVREQSILSGIITEQGAPVARTVRGYRRSDGALMAETTSAAVDGTFSMDVTTDEECYVVALDDNSDGNDYNAQIADRMTPGH